MKHSPFLHLCFRGDVLNSSNISRDLSGEGKEGSQHIRKSQLLLAIYGIFVISYLSPVCTPDGLSLGDVCHMVLKDLKINKYKFTNPEFM